MKSLFLLLLFSIAAASAQTVTTIVNDPGYRFTDDLLFDQSGNLYGADYSGNAVYKRTPDGTLSVFASGFNTPNGLAFDSQENLFVCDNIGNAIYKLDYNGNFLDTFQVTTPSGIIKDSQSDTLIFTTYGTQSELKKLAPDGTIIDFHIGSPLLGPVGLEYCQNVLYVANFTDRKIFRVEQDTLIYIEQVPGSATSSVGFITCIGNKLMATNFNNHKIYLVDPIAQTVDLFAGSTAGSTDGDISIAKFTSPNGITTNATGDTIYISEYNTRKLRIITGYTLNVDEPEGFYFSMYPNPANTHVVITMNDQQPCTIELRATDGTLLQAFENVQEKEKLIYLEDLAPGFYFITLTTEGKQSTTQRIIKSN